MNEQEIEQLLNENKAVLAEIHETSRRTAKYLRWLRIIDLAKLLLILIPLIAAWLYLEPIVNMFQSSYGEILPTGLFK